MHRSLRSWRCRKNLPLCGLTNEIHFLLSHTLDQIDDEFEMVYRHLINANDRHPVVLDNRVDRIISGIQAQTSLSNDQCAALLLDVVRCFIHARLRHMG